MNAIEKYNNEWHGPVDEGEQKMKEIILILLTALLTSEYWLIFTDIVKYSDKNIASIMVYISTILLSVFMILYIGSVIMDHWND